MSGLFERLRAAAGDDWTAYVEHPFVRGLGDGSLPESAFRRYLGQDYLFLIEFARAYGLAVYKGESLEDMRASAAALHTILDVEIGHHVATCARWGLDEPDLLALPPAPEMTAYTGYVLERGMAGDLLDLHVALAPCIVGYAEIGARLAVAAGTDRPAHAYGEWIATYAGREFQAAAEGERALLDRLFAANGGDARFPALAEIFRTATGLEIDFWAMGLRADG